MQPDYADVAWSYDEACPAAHEIALGWSPDGARLAVATWDVGCDAPLRVRVRDVHGQTIVSRAWEHRDGAPDLNTAEMAVHPLRGRDLNERGLLLQTWPDVRAWVVAQGCDVTSPYTNLGNVDEVALPGGGSLRVVLVHDPGDGWWARVVNEGPDGRVVRVAQLAVGDVGETMPAHWVLDPVNGGALGVSWGEPYAGDPVPHWLARTAVELMPAPTGGAVAVTLRVDVIHGNGMSAIDGQALSIVP